MANYQTGTVVSGTHRNVDLIGPLAETLYNLDPDRYFEWLGTGAQGVLTHLLVERSFEADDDEDLARSMVMSYACAEGMTTRQYSKGRKRPLVRDDDNLEVLLRVQEFISQEVNNLFDALNEVAPEGTYFGANEGDGSDFGFWEVSE